MIIDAWAQHPTLRHAADAIFDSLRRWTKTDVPTEELPVSATIAASSPSGCCRGCGSCPRPIGASLPSTSRAASSACRSAPRSDTPARSCHRRSADRSTSTGSPSTSPSSRSSRAHRLPLDRRGDRRRHQARGGPHRHVGVHGASLPARAGRPPARPRSTRGAVRHQLPDAHSIAVPRRPGRAGTRRGDDRPVPRPQRRARVRALTRSRRRSPTTALVAHGVGDRDQRSVNGSRSRLGCMPRTKPMNGGWML